MKINLTRDSVCAGDDMDAPHSKVVDVPDEISVNDLFKFLKINYLPKIDGGKATWIIKGVKPIGILAQEHDDAFPLPNAENFIMNNIHCVYMCQDDPIKIFKEYAK